jgi:hypothetical protein
MAEDDPPLAILQAVALAGALSSMLRRAIDLAAHVFQIDREGKVP